MTRGVPAFNFGANDEVSWDQTFDMEFLSNLFPLLPDIPKATSHRGVWQTVYATANLVRFHSNQVFFDASRKMITFTVGRAPHEFLVLSRKESY